MKIKIQKLHEDAKLPKIGSPGAACVDLVATKIYVDDKNHLATVHLGFATAIPEGYKMVITPMSSFTQKGWVLQNSPGIIDSDYRGEWMLKFEAVPQNIRPTTFTAIFKIDYLPFPYNIGDRVAQVSLEKVNTFQWDPVVELEESERGKGGFGSTGE